MSTDITSEPVVVGRAPRGRYAPDLTEYLADLAELDATDAQKLELLEILWAIMVQFVKLGFSTNLCEQLSTGFNRASASAGQDVEFDPSTMKETYGDTYKEQRNE